MRIERMEQVYLVLQFLCNTCGLGFFFLNKKLLHVARKSE